MKNYNYARILILALNCIWPAHAMSQKHDLPEVDKTTEQPAKRIRTADSSSSSSHANIYAAAQPIATNQPAASASFASSTHSQSTQDTPLLVSANGKYAAAQSNSSEPESWMKSKNLVNQTADILKKQCEQIIHTNPFNKQSAIQLSKIYSREITIQVAKLLTQKYEAELNKIIKPGIESAFATRIAPCWHVEDHEYPNEHFNNEGHARTALKQVGIAVASFIENRAADWALIRDKQGTIYIYNIQTHALYEIDHENRTPVSRSSTSKADASSNRAVVKQMMLQLMMQVSQSNNSNAYASLIQYYEKHMLLHESDDENESDEESDKEGFCRTAFDYCPVSRRAIVLYRDISSSEKNSTSVKKIVLYDFTKNQKTFFTAPDLTIDDPDTIFLVSHGSFCFICMGTKTVMLNLETKIAYTVGPVCMNKIDNPAINDRYHYGVPSVGIDSFYTSEHTSVYGYVAGGQFNVHRLPQYEGAVAPFTEQQHKIIFQETSALCGETILFNHNQTYTLRVASTGQTNLQELKTGKIIPVCLSQNSNYQLTHFDYHAATGQLICVRKNHGYEDNIDLYKLETRNKPCTAQLTHSTELIFAKTEKIKNILFNNDGSYCFVTYQNKTVVMNLNKQQTKTIIHPLVGQPTQHHAVFLDEKGRDIHKIEAMVYRYNLATETMHGLLTFDIAWDGWKNEYDPNPAARLIAVSPNGKYLVSANSNTQPSDDEGTLHNNIVLWNLETGKQSAFEVKRDNSIMTSLVEQDSFITALSFYNDTYVIGVCRKGYVYIGNIKTMQLHQLQRKRTFDDGTPMLNQYCLKNQFSSNNLYIKTETVASYAASANDASSFEDQAIFFNPNNGEINRIYDLEHANLAHALTTIELPQLLMIMRLIQKNQFYTSEYNWIFNKLSPNLQAIFTKYCIKKELAELAQVIPTHDVQNLICDYYDCKPDTLAKLDENTNVDGEKAAESNK